MRKIILVLLLALSLVSCDSMSKVEYEEMVSKLEYEKEILIKEIEILEKENKNSKALLENKTEMFEKLEKTNSEIKLDLYESKNSYDEILDSYYLPKQSQKIISKKSGEILNLLNTNNFEELSEYFHPELGVRFSPLIFVYDEFDLVFSRSEFLSGLKEENNYYWNEENSESGIELTISDYMDLHVYDNDYENADKVGYNQSVHQYGLGRLFNEYEDSIIADYYFEGGEGELAVYWKGLSIVFQKYGDEWFIVGFVHNEWEG